MLSWQELEQACLSCTRCGLCETRHNVVFGIGNETADILFVGEGPGEQEDLQGIPFVGPAGQLLDLYLEAVGIAREQVYIANILKCRPPRNRDPLPEEGNFTEVFRDLEPLVYLPFEEENTGADVRGKLYRVAGIRGSAMGFQDGFLTMESPTLAQGYSLAFWVKPDPWISQEGTVAAAVGSSCCLVDGQRGMAVEVGIDYVRFCQKGPKGDCPVLMDMTYAAPIGEKWSYIAVTVDKYRNQFGVSVDFGPIQYWNIPENMELLTGGRLYIGQDEAERFENRLRGAMDDFCIFGCALTDADLLRLKEYYQI